MTTSRRFPPPWQVEQIPGGIKVLDASGQAPIPFLRGDFVMTIDEFGDFVGRLISFAIGIPVVLASLLVAYWLVVIILRLFGVIELPDPIDWLPTEWTQHLPLPT